MIVKEIRCDCCGKILDKYNNKIIHGKFSKKEFFYDSQGGCFCTVKYDFCENCWHKILEIVKNEKKVIH